MNVRDIFETMEYGPAPEAAGEAMAWLDAHGRRFGLFIGGRFTKPGDDVREPEPGHGRGAGGGDAGDGRRTWTRR